VPVATISIQTEEGNKITEEVEAIKEKEGIPDLKWYRLCVGASLGTLGRNSSRQLEVGSVVRR
jgi:hypothetical protein